MDASPGSMPGGIFESLFFFLVVGLWGDVFCFPPSWAILPVTARKQMRFLICDHFGYLEMATSRGWGCPWRPGSNPSCFSG